MRLLVTGGAGFIGSNFVHYWLERYPDDHVVVYDLLTYAGNRPNLAAVDDRIVFVQGDICDRDLAERTLRDERVEVVVNFAAESHNSLAVVDPTRFFRTNVLGTQTLLDAPARRASSASTTSPPARSTATCRSTRRRSSRRSRPTARGRPTTPRRRARTTRCAPTRRPSAPGHDHELLEQLRAVPVPEKVIPLFTTHALDDEPLPLYASVGHKREWLHVLDHRAAIDLVLREGREGETYNVGSGVEATIEEVADLVLELTGKPASLKTIVPDRPGHDRRYLLDATKIRRELGWEPEHDWRRGARGHRRLVHGEPGVVGPLRGRAPVAETAWR